MGAKGRFFTLCFALFLLGSAGNLPKHFLTALPSAEVILPQAVSYTPTVSCSGVLQAASCQEVYTPQNLMITQVSAAEGAWVNKGDILAEIDVELSQKLAAAVPEQADESQLQAYYELARQYGMEEKLEDYLAQNEAPQNAEIQPISRYITAPCSGKLLAVNMKNGQLAEAGQLLYALSPDEACVAILEVEEGELAQVKEGSPVLLTGPGLNEKHFTACISHISPVAVQTFSGLESRTVVKVTAVLAEKDALLRPGLTVNAQIAAGNTDRLYSVPYEAVAQDENNQEYVYQLENGYPVRRYITVKNELADCVQIASGLLEDAAVIYNAASFDPEISVKYLYRESWND